MRMLEKDESADDTPVTRQDQANINAFSQYNAKYDELTERLDMVNKELEDIDELEPEIELMDEDEVIMYKLDSSFLRLPASEILTLLQGSLEKLRGERDHLEKERQECDDGMNKLKAVLYAKFGNSINLERGD